jgi:hypothetical protein
MRAKIVAFCAGTANTLAFYHPFFTVEYNKNEKGHMYAILRASQRDS